MRILNENGLFLFCDEYTLTIHTVFHLDLNRQLLTCVSTLKKIFFA